MRRHASLRRHIVSCAQSPYQLTAQTPHQLAALARAGMRVIARVERPGQLVEPVIERGSGKPRPFHHARTIIDAAHCKPDARGWHAGGKRNDREIAMPQRKFRETLALSLPC